VEPSIRTYLEAMKDHRSHNAIVGVLLGVILVAVALNCLRTGRIWRPRTVEFTTRQESPIEFWFGFMIVAGLGLWLLQDVFLGPILSFCL
jgi:hypothetical protein